MDLNIHFFKKKVISGKKNDFFFCVCVCVYIGLGLLKEIDPGVRSAVAQIHFLEFTSWVALGNSPKLVKH